MSMTLDARLLALIGDWANDDPGCSVTLSVEHVNIDTYTWYTHRVGGPVRDFVVFAQYDPTTETDEHCGSDRVRYFDRDRIGEMYDRDPSGAFIRVDPPSA